jgi:hypothetical protein
VEEQVMIRFFMLKGLKARALHTELESMDGVEALALPTAKNGGDVFTKGERIGWKIPGPEGPE